MMGPESDRQLVANALENPQMFAQIVEKYEKKIDAYLKSLIFASIEDREDILQEVFIAAYRYLNSYKPEFALSTWLYRIAHNQAMTFLRKHRTQFANEQTLAPSDSEDEEKYSIEALISDENVEENVEKLLKLASVKKKMLELSIQDREILTLRYCEEQGYKEIASILRVPEGTVASMIHRAKAKLITLVNHEQAK
jgi:RNA polymerase sigma-70 factor (ECF subfamily)